MSQLGIKCPIFGNKSHQECRECSLTEHPCEFPTDFLEMMREENDHQPDRTEFTPSSLLECKRRVALRTTSDYYVNPEHAWNLLRGNMVHALVEEKGKYPQLHYGSKEDEDALSANMLRVMEMYPTGGPVDTIREVRLKTTVETKYGPQVFSGKSDLIVVQKIENGTAFVKIVDYKTKKDIGHDLTAADRKHQMQLNMYAFLVERELHAAHSRIHLSGGTILFGYVDNVEVTELEVVYVDMKKVRRFTTERPLITKGKLTNRANWEYAALELEQMHLLPVGVVEAWVVSQIEEIIEAKQTLPPPLEGDEARLCNWCPMQITCFKLAGKSL